MKITEKDNDTRQKCRWCKKVKSINEMSVVGLVSGVCKECMNAPDAEERHANYLMEGMGNE
jgi:hypothetical protein